MRRIFAHKIIYEGVEHRLSVAEIGDYGSVTISPFEEETEGTEFISGTLLIEKETDADGMVNVNVSRVVGDAL